MSPLFTLFFGLSSTTQTGKISSFWYDDGLVTKLSDPPSHKFLQKIREEPFRGGLEPIPIEGIHLQEARVVEGAIPADLQGTLCRNGAGRTRIGDTQYGHWFDSDGVVSKLEIDGSKQKATFMAKYVETERFQKQCQVSQTTGNVPMATAGAWTKRGTGGLLDNIFAFPTNPANTNVLFLENPKDQSSVVPKLFALSEGGDPVEMDPITLETLDAKAFVNSRGESVESFFSAHYKKDPITNELFNHGVILGPTCFLNAMKLTSTGELISQSSVPLPTTSFIHDGMLSENHLILILQPVLAPSSALMTSMFGGEPLGSQLKWDTETLPESTAFIFSKDTMECVAQVSLPELSTYHQIDAFEDSGSLSLRVMTHNPPSSRTRLEEGFKDLYSHSRLPLCMITEFVIDLEKKILVDTRPIAPSASPFELPDMNVRWGHKKRYVWTNTCKEEDSFLSSLQKIDMEKGDCSNIVSFGENSFAGNPLFVPKKNGTKEDDGFILSQIYRANEHRSDICILDASTMEQVALLELNCHITYQFHGEWYPGLL